MRRKITLLLAIGTLALTGVRGEERDTCQVIINVFDSFTYERVDSLRGELLAEDSTVLVKGTAAYWRLNSRGKSQDLSSVVVPVVRSGKYLLRVAAPGYETLYHPMSVRLTRRSDRLEAAPVYLRKLARSERQRELGEAVVQATKIKMVMKGDTVVYNADAFQLSQGSMLDALIEQLPGAELSDDGVITVNGRRVSSLLVNGKDFFRGDPRVALDNLPAYMVDKVKVYEQTSDLDRFRGLDPIDKPLVMDVGLKREYAVGWIANAEAAYGSDKRYLGRAFAMMFTPRSRLALFGSANNTNDTRRPGRQGDWTPAEQPTGLQAAKTAGAEYSYDNPRRGLELTSNADFAHYDTDQRTRTVATSFLTGGNNYRHADRQTTACRTTFKTNHDFKLQPSGRAYHQLRAAFDYDDRRGDGLLRAGTFSSDPYDRLAAGVLDSLFLPGGGERLRQIAVNRQREASRTDGYAWSVSVPYTFSFKPIPGVNDNLTLTASFAYDRADYKAFNHYLLDYPATPDAATDFRNRYRTRPNRHYKYGARANYMLWVKRNVYMNFSYAYTQEYRSGRDDLYRLDSLDGWGYATDHALGELPSTTTALQQALDLQNHEHSEYWAKKHVARYFAGFIKSTDDGEQHQVELTLPLYVDQERLRYERGTYFTDRDRLRVYVNPRVQYNAQFVGTKRNGWRRSTNLTVNYSYTMWGPDMFNELDVVNDADPLYVQRGNPNLHRSQRHEASIWLYAFKYGSGRTVSLFNLQLRGGAVRDQVAMGQTYDPATGGYTVRPENVDGNWWVNGTLTLNRDLGPKKYFLLSSVTSPGFTHSVDLLDVSGDGAPARSVVRQTYLNETLKLNFTYKQWRAGLKVGANWTHARSRREGFTTVNAVDLNYGLSARIPIPGGVELSTDLTLYSRRGYEERSMNTDELVWNARLAKSILKGNLTFMVDAFDILGNLSNVRRTLNAQGRTETWYNVIPRYVMAHVVYRLNIQPRKRGAD